MPRVEGPSGNPPQVPAEPTKTDGSKDSNKAGKASSKGGSISSALAGVKAFFSRFSSSTGTTKSLSQKSVTTQAVKSEDQREKYTKLFQAEYQKYSDAGLKVPAKLQEKGLSKGGTLMDIAKKGFIREGGKRAEALKNKLKELQSDAEKVLPIRKECVDRMQTLQKKDIPEVAKEFYKRQEAKVKEGNLSSEVLTEIQSKLDYTETYAQVPKEQRRELIEDPNLIPNAGSDKRKLADKTIISSIPKSPSSDI